MIQRTASELNLMKLPQNLMSRLQIGSKQNKYQGSNY